jgi:hypothetical protein
MVQGDAPSEEDHGSNEEEDGKDPSEDLIIG